MAFNKNKKQDKYNAVWLSHSSVSDYLKCPRLYYLHNLWKNENARKVNFVSPHMTLGSAVHGVIEPLAEIKTEDRFREDLLKKYENIWSKFSGKWGGFKNEEEEKEFKNKGVEMIKNVLENKGPLSNKTIKFYQGDFIPNIYLSETENIILCGLVDWVEYLEETDSLRVIDFKTGGRDESEESMQLPIYKILVETLQKRKVTGAAYWYLARDKKPKEKELFDEDVEEIKNKILNIGIEIKKIKESSKNQSEMFENFKCKSRENGFETCKFCDDFLAIKNKDFEKIEYVGVGEYNQDLYTLKK
jgi:ATP-dependent helicase/DNAse subunit B